MLIFMGNHETPYRCHFSDWRTHITVPITVSRLQIGRASWGTCMPPVRRTTSRIVLIDAHLLVKFGRYLSYRSDWACVFKGESCIIAPLFAS